MKVELAYFCQTHKPDTIAWLDLFKLNKISNKELLENLMILLSDRDNMTGTVINLPTNPDSSSDYQRCHPQSQERRSNFTARDQ